MTSVCTRPWRSDRLRRAVRGAAGGLTPIGAIVAAFALGALLHGGDGLQVGANVSPEIVQVVLGLILLAYAIQRGRSATRRSGSEEEVAVDTFEAVMNRPSG